MASYTSNLNLKKPAGSESVAIGDINGNMDTIDSAYGTLDTKVNHWEAGGSISNNTDLNNFVTPGIYLLASASTYRSMPPDGGAVNVLLIAKPSGSTVLQFGLGTGNVYYRFRSDATHWQNWRKISATAVT